MTPPPPLDFFFEKNASHWGNVNNVKNLKGLPTKKVLKTGEMLKMLKMLKVFWVLTPPPCGKKWGEGGGQDPENFLTFLTFLTFPQF